ncbi:hypothetical protein KR222_009810, partial [Zaprionus bogoriensis]
MSNNNYLLALTVGAAGALLLGYCIYYDRKRRADPDYRRKVRERRQKSLRQYPMSFSALTASESMDSHISAVQGHSFQLTDHEIVQHYFQNEIKLGEELFRVGKLDEGLMHMANAIMLCAQPAALMDTMKLALPNRIYNSLLSKLPELQL